MGDARPETAQGSVKQTVKFGQDPLQTVATGVDFEQCCKTARDLVATAEDHIKQKKVSPMGMAANQIGSLDRVFVFRQDYGRPFIVAIDPEILSTYEGVQKTGKEGCLSYPDHYARVLRFDKIRVSYKDLAGRKHRKFLRGFEARVFQHELDHLQGICLVGDSWHAEQQAPSEGSLDLGSGATGEEQKTRQG